MCRYRRARGRGQNPGVETNMSKKVLLIAGVVLAAGSVAALSSPYFRGGQLRLGDMFAELGGGGDPDDRPRRSGKRHREMDADRDGSAVRRSGRRFDAANDEGGEDREGFTKSRRERSAMRDHDEEEGSRICGGASDAGSAVGLAIARTARRLNRARGRAGLGGTPTARGGRPPSGRPGAAIASSPVSTRTATASSTPRTSRRGPRTSPPARRGAS